MKQLQDWDQDNIDNQLIQSLCELEWVWVNCDLEAVKVEVEHLSQLKVD